jgi:cytoskeletal protein CcmA (bactofilin family)
MPIQLKRSLTSGSLPTTASLVPGELALNVPDGRIFLRKSGSGSDTIQSAITTGAQNSGSVALTGSLSLYSATGSVLDISGDVVSIDGDVIEIAADTMEFTGSFLVSGSVSVLNNEFGVQPTGVNLGNLITDRHTVTGSLSISGSTVVSGSLTVAGNFFGSVATASLALTASLAFTASSANDFLIRNAFTSSRDAIINTHTLGRGLGNNQTNTAFGFQALNSNTSGDGNTAIGNTALKANAGAYGNTAVGSGALTANTSGIWNTAVGANALTAATTANNNVAIGARAAQSITTATDIIAIGSSAFQNGIPGSNILIGTNAGISLTNAAASNNVLIGHNAGTYSTTMSGCTAIGHQALLQNTTGTNNIGIGFNAGNIASLSGNNNIFIGVNTVPVVGSDSNRTFIGNDTTATTWLGGNLLLGTKTDDGLNRLQVAGATKLSGSLAVTGSLRLTGSLAITGSINASQGYTGSLFGTASWATNAILFPFTGSARITGSIALSGSLVSLGSQVLFVAQDITPTGSISSSYFTISGSVRQPPTVGSRGMFVDISPMIFYSTSSQVNTAFRLNATFSGSSAFTSSQSNVIADFGSTSAGSQLTVTDVTSGSIYMVNDVSGLPIIEANSNWDVFIYDYPNTVFKKTGSTLELGVSNNTSSAVIVESDLIFNEGYGITHRLQQVSASTAGSVTSSLYTIPFTNISSSVYLTAIVTGYDTGSRDTISGEIKGTLRYRAGVASLVGTNYTYLNSDNSTVNFELFAGGTSGSILVYGTGSRTYQWGATVTTQII